MNKRITKKQKKESLILSEDYEKLFHLTDQLPHSFILEKTILSCILIHSDTSFQTLEIIMEHLPIEAFYFKNHQCLYIAFIEMYSQDRSIDFITTVDYIQCSGIISQIGGLNVISELLKEIPTLIYLMDYIYLVKQNYLRRCIIKLGLKIIDNGFIMNFPIRDQLIGLESELRKLTKEIEPTRKNFSSAESLNNVIEDLWKKVRQPGQLSGISSGFIELDSYTDGFQKSELIIIAGRPSVGKTAFGLNIVLNVLKKTR